MMKKIALLLFWFFCLWAGFLLVGNSVNAQDTWTSSSTSTASAGPNMWINITPDCMLGVGCTFDIQKTLGLRKDTGNEERTSVLLFVQDVILAATMLIGTVVTIVLIRSGVLFILAGRKGDAGLQKKATQGMLYAVIGLVLVTCSYGIIQLIRYIATT